MPRGGHACRRGHVVRRHVVRGAQSARRHRVVAENGASQPLTLDHPTSNGGAEIVAYVFERPERLSPTWTHVARVRPQTDANLAERSDYHFRVCVENVEICQTDGCQIVFTATADGHGDNQDWTG